MKLPLELLLLSITALSAPLAPRSASFPQLAGLTSNTKDLSTTDSRFPQKYFHESIHHPHYDGRFATSVLSRKTRLFHMRLLLRSYMMAMERARVRTWVMHGSLLGWWWNGGVFPWDSDLDFCVDEEGMGELGAWWNMTVHAFSAKELGLDVGFGRNDLRAETWESYIKGHRWRNGNSESMEKMSEPEGLKTGVWTKVVEEGKKYLLEVNPHFTDSSTSDRTNKIDARWIDTSNGLFIDLTTVHPVPSPNAIADTERRKHKILLDEAGGAPKPGGTPVHAEDMYTKDTHLYKTASLFPLRESTFEGTRVFVPYAYEQLLIEEYGPQALTETWFNSYKFDAETKEWDIAPEPRVGKEEGDREDAEARYRKAGKKPKWRPVSDREKNRKDNKGGEVYVPKSGGADDVHMVPGGAT